MSSVSYVTRSFRRTVRSRLVLPRGEPFPPNIEPNKIPIAGYDAVKAAEWKRVGTEWHADAMASRQEVTSDLSGFTLVGNKLHAVVEFPQLLEYVGFPTALYFSLSLSFEPIEKMGGMAPRVVPAFQTDKQWKFTVDLSKILDQADLKPAEWTVQNNLVHAVAWAYGVLKDSLPRLEVEIDSFWSTAVENDLGTDQYGQAILSATMALEQAREPVAVESCGCKCHINIGTPPLPTAVDWEII